MRVGDVGPGIEMAGRKDRERKRGTTNGILGNYDSGKLELRACRMCAQR